jgi:hypothetical protein
MMDDGTAGLMIVVASGGKAIVQDRTAHCFRECQKTRSIMFPRLRQRLLMRYPELLLQLIRTPLTAIKEESSNTVFDPAKETRIMEHDMNEISNEQRCFPRDS